MGIFGTVAMPRKVQGMVYIEPLAKHREIVFDDVRPFDILEIPLDARRVTDIKAYGAKRRLGPKRYRIDYVSRIVQVTHPPRSGVVRIEWIEHESMRVIGPAEVSMAVSTVTYRSVEEAWTADVDAITPGKLSDTVEGTLRNLRGY